MAESIKNLFVIDASFVLAFLLDEGNLEVESIFEKQALGEINFVAPPLLKYEVGNSLRSKVLRKKIKKEKAQRLYKLFLGIKIDEKNLNYHYVLSLALEKNLSFYDASYLSLAKKYRIPILTLDNSLK